MVSPLETVATKLIRDPALTLPAAAVPLSAGQALLARSGATVRLRVDARRYASTGHNVVAHLPGRTAGRVAVAAHYDTAAGVPGATDNASGTAAVLELCEVFAARSRALGLDFVAFGADEYGRTTGANLGAAEYVRRHPAEVGQTRAVVEADGVGTAPRRPRVRLIGWPAGARDALLDVLRRFPAYEVNDQSGQPDARPTAFNLPGVPARLRGRLPLPAHPHPAGHHRPDERGGAGLRRGDDRRRRRPPRLRRRSAGRQQSRRATPAARRRGSPARPAR